MEAILYARSTCRRKCLFIFPWLGTWLGTWYQVCTALHAVVEYVCIQILPDISQRPGIESTTTTAAERSVGRLPPTNTAVRSAVLLVICQTCVFILFIRTGGAAAISISRGTKRKAAVRGQ